MNDRSIVFDVDDVLWGLNKRVTSSLGIDYNKITDYSVKKISTLSDLEKKNLLNSYSNPEMFIDIKWYDGVKDILKLEDKGCKVYINSNSFSDKISNLKREQLKSVLPLPDNRLIFNNLSEGGKKEINERVFCFVDDNPYNIADSCATYNIMIKTPWNKSKDTLKMLSCKNVVILDSLIDIIVYIENLLDIS